jgi:hypothetical protein
MTNFEENNNKKDAEEIEEMLNMRSNKEDFEYLDDQNATIVEDPLLENRDGVMKKGTLYLGDTACHQRNFTFSLALCFVIFCIVTLFIISILGLNGFIVSSANSRVLTPIIRRLKHNSDLQGKIIDHLINHADFMYGIIKENKMLDHDMIQKHAELQNDMKNFKKSIDEFNERF